MSARRAGSAGARAVPLLASLACLLVLFGTAVSGPGVGQSLIIAVTVGALAVLLATAGRIAPRAAPAVLTSSARAGEVDAPPAYWCALAAATCPRRPRAPGRS